MLGKRGRTRDTAVVESLVGARLAGRYRLEAVVGTGATATVYRALREGIGDEVAVKVLDEKLARNPHVVRAFTDEALAGSRIDHPGAVAVLDRGRDDEGRLYLVTELVRGRTLRAHLADGPPPLAIALDWAIQLLDALGAAHRAGVIHLDVKPENVLLEPEPRGRYRARLCDFGLAALAERRRGAHLVRGTGVYMAPEQVVGGDVDARADLYALGVLLYELVAGAPPFDEDRFVDLIGKILTVDPPPLPARTADHVVPAALGEAVARALRKSRGERFADAEAFASALRPLAHAAPTTAPPRGHEIERWLGGVGGALALVGPPGAGRAALEAALAASGDRWAVLSTEADPSGAARPYLPIRRMLAALLRLDAPRDVGAVERALVDRGFDPELARPGIATLFGLPAADPDLEWVHQRDELRAAALHVLRTQGVARLLLFEDVHLYDEASRHLVERLLVDAGDGGARVVVTRPDRPRGVRHVVEVAGPAHATAPRRDDGDDGDAVVSALRRCAATEGQALPPAERAALVEACARAAAACAALLDDAATLVWHERTLRAARGAAPVLDGTAAPVATAYAEVALHAGRRPLARQLAEEVLRTDGVDPTTRARAWLVLATSAPEAPSAAAVAGTLAAVPADELGPLAVRAVAALARARCEEVAAACDALLARLPAGARARWRLHLQRAEAAAQGDRGDDARVAAERALEAAGALDAATGAARAHELLAELAARRGDGAAADRHELEAAAALRRIGDRHARARLLIRRAERLLAAPTGPRDGDRRDEALGALREAARLGRGLEGSALVDKAQALLDEHAPRRR